MKTLAFPQLFEHRHAPLRIPHDIYEQELTVGQRAADWVANNVGSWPFIIGQSIVLVFWCILNVLAWVRHWDPYPFIFLNLILSLEGAFTAPLVMMSQNRQDAIDRIEAHSDYMINQKVEEEIHLIMDHLTAQNEALIAIYAAVEEMRINTRVN
jgi:uncharacterized membrane protein